MTRARRPANRSRSNGSNGSAPIMAAAPAVDPLATQIAATLAHATLAEREAWTQALRSVAQARQEANSQQTGTSSRVPDRVPDDALYATYAQLAEYAPQLHEHPDLLTGLETLLARAQSRAEALAESYPQAVARLQAEQDEEGLRWLADGGYTRYGGGRPSSVYGGDGASSSSWYVAGAGVGGPARPTGSVGQSVNAGGGTVMFAGDNERNRPVGVPNARTLRVWADTVPWLRAAINARRDQIGDADLDVLPVSEQKGRNQKLETQLKLLLEQPNELDQNLAELMGSVVEDYFVLGRGAIEKAMTVGRTPARIYGLNAAGLKIYPQWDGDPDTPHYLWDDPDALTPSQDKRPLRNDECIVLLDNPATYRFGLSRVQVLVSEIESEVAAMKAAKRAVGMKPPAHLINLPGYTRTSLERLANRFETEFAGKRDLMFTGTDSDKLAQVFSLVTSARDSQFLELQIYLARKICAVLQISPQQLGITFDINRATSETQQTIYEDAGLIPLMLRFERYLNRELLGNFCPKYPDGRSNFEAVNLRIVFPQISESSRILHAQQVSTMLTSALAGLPFMTLNQALSMLGEEPLPEHGNSFIAMTAQGPVVIASYDGETTADFNGETATGPELGAQDAAGGPSLDEADTNTQKPEQPAGAAATDASSGNGMQPNMNPDDAAGAQMGGAAASGARGASSKALLSSLAFAGPDHRRPGVAWNAATALRQRALALPAATRPARPRPAPPPVVRQAPPPRPGDYTRALVAAAVHGGDTLEPELLRRARPHPHVHPHAPGADVATEAQAALASLGRVPPERAARHQSPAGVQDARATLRAQAGHQFEQLARRGRQQVLAAPPPPPLARADNP